MGAAVEEGCSRHIGRGTGSRQPVARLVLVVQVYLLKLHVPPHARSDLGALGFIRWRRGNSTWRSPND